ncbi:1-aminocyclopropane-1-carboxylate deaminase/D-cysteine desulfhydrase [Desulfatibacillum aliphaticivorans]|uniref:1-aminocyclopropane-1-carboxylate deaminase/D-cysteine desulfhydrase n=1 Tax=Desulfatibacillum aliphaticivorans TaxID=218208 RepID=UPI0003FDE8BF|nr:pyridoxal-phosphate dependent enzyme [Desulfatibacillum aliphaticivorans]
MPGIIWNRELPLLFKHHESLRENIPWTPLVEQATPVERLDALSREAGADIWVKRDDLTSPVYGGNKVRKLEFLLAHAQKKGSKALITMGALGTNHGLATAMFGKKAGLDVVLKLTDQPVNEHVLQNLRLFASLGAKMDYCGGASGTVWSYYIAHRLQNAGGYYIPAGGSNSRGVLGYVEAGLEIADQVSQGVLPRPKKVFVAAGTCGTLAGLTLGFSLADMKTSVHGVRVTPTYMANRNKVMGLALRSHALLKYHGAKIPEFRSNAGSLEIDSRQYGAGYGHETPQGQRAVSMAWDLEGVKLDPTYTGKTFAAVLDEAPKAKGPVLFINTFNSVDMTDQAEAVAPDSLPKPLAQFFPAA